MPLYSYPTFSEENNANLLVIRDKNDGWHSDIYLPTDRFMDVYEIAEFITNRIRYGELGYAGIDEHFRMEYDE